MDQTKKEEGQEQVKISPLEGANDFQQGDTFGNITAEEIQNKKIKNLISAIIILVGVVFGSLFVDVAQFLTQSGYSGRALKDTDIFSSAGKTWVSFDDPIVDVQVLTVSDDEMKSCPNCDPSEVLYQLKKVVPTLIAKKVVDTSDEGKKLIEQYQINALPAFIFSKDITKTSFYSQSGVSSVFDEKDGGFVLNSNVLGIPAGKYLKMPEVADNDAIMGNKDAKVKIIVFSDFQCPYSKMFYDIAKTVVPGYGDQVAFILRDLPLSFHAQSQNAAMAARCAQDQGKFWEMADLLYANQQTWGAATDKEIFKPYAMQIGLNATEFNQCLDGDKELTRISADEKQAGDFGISGTPSGFIGDQFMGGVLQEDQLKQSIDAQLAK